MRIVLDTSILITAVRSPRGAAAAIVKHILASRVMLLMSYPLACEYRDVALRPHHLAEAGLSSKEMEHVINMLERVAVHVEIQRSYRPLSIDPNDDLILDLAINGRADVIVTNNLRHLQNPAQTFGIDTVNPQMFIMMLKEAGLYGNAE